MQYLVFVLALGFPTYRQPHKLQHGKVPSSEQLSWMDKEIGGYIAFGIGMPGAPWIPDGDGCYDMKEPPPAEDFKLSIGMHGWFQALININAGYSILPVSSPCGHLLWDTNITIPGWGVYNYTSLQSSLGVSDVVSAYIATSKVAGISTGMHFSISQNYWLGWNKTVIKNGKTTPKVTAAEYIELAESLLTEILNYTAWSEVWFEEDWFVGFRHADIKKISSQLSTLVPQAVLLRGPGKVQLLRSTGNDKGAAPRPNYLNAPSSQYVGSGVFQGGVVAPDEGYVPISSDLDKWWAPNQTLKSFLQLANEHDATVGGGANLLIAVTPDYSGNIPESYLRYREFGQWRVTCYGKPFAESQDDGSTITFNIPIVPGWPPLCDRIWLREDISNGLCITSYTVEVQVALKWVEVPWLVLCSSETPCSGKKTFGFESVTASTFNGTVVGHKKIIRFGNSESTSLGLNITAVRVNSTYSGCSAPTYTSIALFPQMNCADPYDDIEYSK